MFAPVWLLACSRAGVVQGHELLQQFGRPVGGGGSAATAGNDGGGGSSSSTTTTTTTTTTNVKASGGSVSRLGVETQPAASKPAAKRTTAATKDTSRRKS
jgi:hypothetical protein